MKNGHSTMMKMKQVSTSAGNYLRTGVSVIDLPTGGFAEEEGNTVGPWWTAFMGTAFVVGLKELTWWEGMVVEDDRKSGVLRNFQKSKANYKDERVKYMYLNVGFWAAGFAGDGKTVLWLDLDEGLAPIVGTNGKGNANFLVDFDTRAQYSRGHAFLSHSNN